jgi:cytochrome c
LGLTIPQVPPEAGAKLVSKLARIVNWAGAVAVFSGVCILPITAGLAQNPMQSAGNTMLDGEALYRSHGCSACHGDAGAAPLPEHPSLAGQDGAYLIAQLRDFKKGARTNGLSASMRGYLKEVPDEELVAIAQYLSKQRCR